MPFNNPTALTPSATAAAASPRVQTATPTTGQTVQVTDDGLDTTLRLTPAGGLATLTVTLPTNANSRIGQIVRVTSSQAVAALTVNGATVLNAVAALVANECFGFQKLAANTWVRLQ